MFREEATSAFAGFHAGPLSWSNGNLEMWGFCGARKTGEPGEKPSERGRTNSKHHPDGIRLKWNPGHNGERRALSPLRHPYFPT